MFYHADAQSLGLQFGQELYQQGRFTGAAVGCETQHRWVIEQ